MLIESSVNNDNNNYDKKFIDKLINEYVSFFSMKILFVVFTWFYTDKIIQWMEKWSRVLVRDREPSGCARPRPKVADLSRRLPTAGFIVFVRSVCSLKSRFTYRYMLYMYYTKTVGSYM